MQAAASRTSYAPAELSEGIDLDEQHVKATDSALTGLFAFLLATKKPSMPGVQDIEGLRFLVIRYVITTIIIVQSTPLT